MSLYLIIELCAVIIPLIFSFDKNLQFYKNWKSVIVSFIIVGSIFIPTDIFFTNQLQFNHFNVYSLLQQKAFSIL